MNRREIGANKEEIACRYLMNKGYRILHTNFFIRGGELDIVAKDQDTIVFVEVKYRKNNLYGSPSYGITRFKQMRVSKSALYYIQKNRIPMDTAFRFDCICICGDTIEHIIHAFPFQWGSTLD